MEADSIKGEDEEVSEDGMVLVIDNRIVAVGAADLVEVPDSTVVIDVTGKTLVPGSWTRSS